MRQLFPESEAVTLFLFLGSSRLSRDGRGTVNAGKELPLDLGCVSWMGDDLWQLLAVGELRNHLGSSCVVASACFWWSSGSFRPARQERAKCFLLKSSLTVRNQHVGNKLLDGCSSWVSHCSGCSRRARVNVEEPRGFMALSGSAYRETEQGRDFSWY